MALQPEDIAYIAHLARLEIDPGDVDLYARNLSDLIDLDDMGRIKVDCFARTNMPGLFAAGDVTNSYAEQVLVAVGEGAKAALSAYEYLLPLL